MWNEREGIKPFAFTHVPNSDRTRALERFGLPFGYLLNAVVFAASGAPKLAQTFVSLHVIRGQGQARVLLATLLQGYVTAEQELAFPGSPVQSSVEGAPYTRIIIGTDPAAGVTVAESVPSGARWRLRSLHMSLGTTATAGARRPVLFLRSNAGNLVGGSPSPYTQSPSTNVRFYWMLGMPISTGMSSFQIAIGLPDVIMLPGHDFLVQVENMAAGDNIDEVVFYVDEWLEAQ
jgi:hypothetical protein